MMPGLHEPPLESLKQHPLPSWFQDATRQYHNRTYGEQFTYPDFADQFNPAVERWDPEAWADLFKRIGPPPTGMGR